jgi:hypothetical protein
VFPLPSPLLTVAAAAAAVSYATLTIASGVVSADVTAFPVYVDLSDMPAGFWSGVTSTGADIRVTNVAETVTYPLDLVVIDTVAHTGKLFFKADLTAAASNVFRIKYNTGLSAALVTDPTGRNAVWSNFDRVFDGHANVDRTGSGTTLTMTSGASFTSETILVAGAGDLAHGTAGGDYSNFSFFIVGHFPAGMATGQNHMIGSYLTSWTNTNTRYTYGIRATTFNWAVWNGTNGFLDTGVPAAADTDYTAATTHQSGVARKVYVNGAQVGSTSASAADLTLATPSLGFGAESSAAAERSGGYFNIVMFSANVLSAAYIAGLHTNRRSRGSFYTVA